MREMVICEWCLPDGSECAAIEEVALAITYTHNFFKVFFSSDK